MALALLVAISGPKTSQFLVFIFGSTVHNNRTKKGLIHCVNRTFVILLRNLYNFSFIIFIPNRSQVLFSYTQQTVKLGLVRLSL
jgi:hypothetical protein